MQKRSLKIPGISLFLITLAVLAQAQTSSYRLQTADSLFDKKQYTQSFEHYEAVLKNNEYTPAMFLKMAYIQEGLGNIGRALYYLTLYQKTSKDRSALIKMNDLAQKFQLEGYETTDLDLALTWYHESYTYITYALAAVCIFLMALALRMRFRMNRKPLAVVIVNLFFTLLLSVHIYYGDIIAAGIIADANTFIMKGPSPGSDVVERVGEGHRVDVIGRTDVWLKVRWHGEVAYVKENGVLVVNL